MPNMEDFQVGDYIETHDSEGHAFGVITNRSIKYGEVIRDRWTIKRDDGVGGGDTSNHGWICTPEKMRLIRRDVATIDNYFT